MFILCRNIKKRYEFSATDKLGNVSNITKTIYVYSVNDIVLDYSNMASDLIKLTSKGEEFFASATDSFGESCDITIEAYSGSLQGGMQTSIYIVATDAAGNIKKSELISNIKIYEEPNVILSITDYIINENTDITFLFTAYDSFNEELYVEVTTDDNIVPGAVVTISVSVSDDAGNTVEKSYQFGVVSNEKPAYVELVVDGTVWKSVIVDSLTNYQLEVPDNYSLPFAGWSDDTGYRFTDEDGNGTGELLAYNKLYASSDYIPIYTVSDFTDMKKDGNYLLMNDIDLKNTTWDRISFSGTFDGQNHTISNCSATSLFLGNTGQIRNLTLMNFQVSNGGILCRSNSGIIENCFATGRTSSNNSGQGSNLSSYAGGLVAVNYDSGIIRKCGVDVAVTVSCGFSVGNEMYAYAGGLVGYNASGSISNCYASGNVTAKQRAGSQSGTLTYKAYSYAGGLVGYNYGEISDCYALGNVSSTAIPNNTGGGDGFACAGALGDPGKSVAELYTKWQ